MNKLRVYEVKGAVFTGVNQKLVDGGGLYLFINKAGKYWRYDYRFQRKRKTLALGVFPEISLQMAREKHLEARQELLNERDPGNVRKAIREEIIRSTENSFGKLAWEWFSHQRWTEGHARTVKSRLEQNVIPWIGEQPADEITARDILMICRRIEERGAIETAHRVKSICSQVFRYAIALGICNSDPCRDLKNALTPSVPVHMPAITSPTKVGELMRAIHGFRGSIVTRSALRLAPLVFVRPGELRSAEWSEIDLETGMWKIPAPKMKMRQAHIVPLSHQAIGVLKDVFPLTGKGKYVFPSVRTSERPMSDSTLLSVLRRLGFERDEMTVHGFRGMASTLLHEQGWDSKIIEKQLAHQDGNSVRAAYNHAEYLKERRELMQHWADYLYQL